MRVLDMTRVGDDQPRPRILEHLLQTIRRIRRIQNDVELTRLQHRDDRGENLAAMVEHEGDWFRPRLANGEDRTRETVRRLVQRTEGEGPAAPFHRQPIAVRPHLLLEALRDRLIDIGIGEGPKVAVLVAPNALEKPHGGIRSFAPTRRGASDGDYQPNRASATIRGMWTTNVSRA